MKRNGKRNFVAGSIFMGVFVIWTACIQIVDLQAIGANDTAVGFATLNSWFHKLTGVHMEMYIITDWLGLVPIFICMIFGGLGFCQLVKRRSLLKVDYDILCLGVYYILTIFCYLIFEMIPINYRPILIEGRVEASYPSSTTLLVLCVMPTLWEQTGRRVRSNRKKQTIRLATICFTIFMILGRLISGVHWVTDIIGAILLSAGLFSAYKAVILAGDKEN